MTTLSRLASRPPLVHPGAPAPGTGDVPRRPRSHRASDVAELGGSALSAICLTWLLFYRLTALSGALGFTLVWYVLFTAAYYIVTKDGHGTLVARDRLAGVLMASAGLVAVAALAFIIGFVFFKGIRYLRPSFFTQTLQTVGPLDPPTAGGGAHAIVGTLQQVGLALVLAVPLAILTAVHLNEVGGRLSKVVRFFVEAMSGVPSIVAGLFVYAMWILQFGNQFSGIAASLALAVLMLPTVTRTAEEMLRLVPGGLREAALALGAPEWRVTRQVVLPTARAGLITAAILGTARAVGETAPVLLTAFGSAAMNLNPLTGPQEDLPLFVYRLVRSSQDSEVARAYTGALVLIALVLALFITARVLGGRAVGSRRRPRLRSVIHRRS